MSTSPDILARQEAYRARPFATRIETSHFSGTFRFETFDAAFEYLFSSFARWAKIVATREYGSSWAAFDTRRSYIETPEGITPARFWLLVDRCATS